MMISAEYTGRAVPARTAGWSCMFWTLQREMKMRFPQTGSEFPSKKVGNSVVRHRIKRRLKEIARLNEDGVKKGYDIVIIARNAAALSGYGELEQSYLRLLTKMHLMDMDAVR